MAVEPDMENPIIEGEEGPGLQPPIRQPPQYYFYVEITNPVIGYLEAPPIRAPGLNYNLCKYFYYCDTTGPTLCPKHYLREIIQNPEEENPFGGQNKTDGIYMLENGHAKVGHLPNRLDIVKGSDAMQVYLKWMLESTSKDDPKIIPPFARWILDPTPTISLSGNIYLLRDQAVDLVVGSYTDAVYVFHVLAPITALKMSLSIFKFLPNPVRTYKATNINFESESFVDGEALPPHMPILIWNVRGAGRPSFIENFGKLIGVHEPKVVILTEARVCYDQFKLLISELKSEMRWGCIEGVGITGGLMILWYDRDVDLKVHDCTPGLDLTLNATIKTKRHGKSRKRIYAI